MPTSINASQARADPGDDITPVSLGQRITALDVLRGFALLGILMMNIEDFSGPEGVHDIPVKTGHPAFVGWHAQLDYALLAFKWLFFEGKMRTLFAMLFGAGIVLLTERFERRGTAGLAADIFSRRNMWLLLFGMLHGTLIWGGDILALYAIDALLFMFPFRHVEPRRLMVLGLALGIAGGMFGMARFFDIPGQLTQEQLRSEGQAALDTHHAPSPAQRDALDAAAKESKKSAHELEESLRTARLPYLQSIGPRTEGFLDALGKVLFSGITLEFGGSMLLGMGLYKIGFFSARLSPRTYVLTATIGYAISAPIVLGGIVLLARHDFSKAAALRWMILPYHVEVFPAAIANTAVVLLLVNEGWLKPVQRALANVGRTAFSNYIGTSLLCQFVFDWGPWKLYGQLEYYQQALAVVTVWTVNLVASALWLRYFAYGPLEWAWRSLTYWRRQPLRLTTTPSPLVPSSQP
jgi:uncharacterized protein